MIVKIIMSNYAMKKGDCTMKRKSFRVLVLSVMLMLLTGCLFRPVEDLYRLPERFPGDESLLREVTKVRRQLELGGNSVEYANIFSGENTTVIQLQDMDGDGHRETAVVFFYVPEEKKSIKIYFFSQIGEDDYQVSGIIEHEATAIYAVDFVDLNGVGKKELVISWQTPGVYQLGAYSLDEQELAQENTMAMDIADPKLEATRLLLSSYNGYSIVDMDGNGQKEIAVVQLDTAGVNSYLELFGYRDGTILSLDSVLLSSGITVLNKIRPNYVDKFVPALYLTSTLMDDSRATDIVTYQDGELTNLTINRDTGISRETLRDYDDVGPTDINSDGILEMPRPKSLPIYGMGSLSDFWLLDWKQYDEYGKSHDVYTTYHNIADGWYLVIPDEWRDKITISRDDSVIGQRTVVFSYWNGFDIPPEPFLSIYQLTGPNRFTRADMDGRFELGGDSTTIYAASFVEGGWDCGLDELELIQNFRLIISSWTD